MPAAEFSEFSYGYAVVRQAEDTELVTVNFALFLQFKRSFFVSRQHP